MADDGQAESQATVHPRCAGIILAKALENVGKKLGRDTLAGVSHDDLHVRIDALQHDIHPSALGAELDGVREQVPDDLLQTLVVAGDRAGAAIERSLKPD